MKAKQLELPIFSQKVWVKMKKNQKNEAIRIVAKMILQIARKENKEENHANKT